MLYRETGQFKESYSADQAIFPILQDRMFILGWLVVAFVAAPLMASEYWFQVILIPFLVFSIATLGLNILVGYCGQISLGSGGFMAVGAFSAYKLATNVPELNIVFVILISGLITAGVGILFGLPSLRIKGFYLAVATLAAQFFLIWMFNKVGWFVNYSPSGSIAIPPMEIFGVIVTSAKAEPVARYFLALSFTVVLALLAKNLVRGPTGRAWMAIRDMDIAAEIIGIKPLATKLKAFAVSSFFIGVAGALFFSAWLGAAETDAFDINLSFNILFMVIIGGLGSVIGSFMGAAFIVLLPILLTNIFVGELGFSALTAKHIEITVFGALIIFFLAVEPHGLARMWQVTKEKLRIWPFPH
jgi:branched-chain amino acid transport system permease protein